MKTFFPFLLLFLFQKTIVAQTTEVHNPSKGKEMTIMFYNTENFFDTINDPNKNDDEFLPEAKLNWNTQKYFSKINHLAAVIDSVGGTGFPALVGLCEVENETVIKDLIKYSS